MGPKLHSFRSHQQPHCVFGCTRRGYPRAHVHVCLMLQWSVPPWLPPVTGGVLGHPSAQNRWQLGKESGNERNDDVSTDCRRPDFRARGWWWWGGRLNLQFLSFPLRYTPTINNAQPRLIKKQRSPRRRSLRPAECWWGLSRVIKVQNLNNSSQLLTTSSAIEDPEMERRWTYLFWLGWGWRAADGKATTKKLYWHCGELFNQGWVWLTP